MTWDEPTRRLKPVRRVRTGVLAGRVVLGVVATLVLALTGYGWSLSHGLATGLNTSGALAGEARSANGDTNILIMGLDSRLDENGNPLPKDIYDALHAGTQSDGGYNSNVLMLLHVPGDGSKATSISIPRDDYVDIPGCPLRQCHGKIKQAYGLAFEAQLEKLLAQGVTDGARRYQQARETARKAEIDTVRQFLGGVTVDHFVEVTMVAFFQVAQVVQPITVCLKENTQDSWSGANFRAGQQQIDAEQAIRFVRQRRDTSGSGLDFTDLDREVRQQAFIASLAYQLKQGGAFTNPAKLQGLLDVAKRNIAIDSGLDLLSFAGQAANLTSGNITFTTLPVQRFGQDSSGEDVNYVDLDQIRATIRHLIGTSAGTAAPPTVTATPTHTAHTGTSAPSPKPTPRSSQDNGNTPSTPSGIGGGGIPCVK
ncbi:LCP family protein [Amycolatopsis pigmentata]|uniref:LCP family protein n=1 Tax=Amycolatopsis pigmentata TaxID=450801 RepID=A0ABW5FVE4_9PSEU